MTPTQIILYPEEMTMNTFTLNHNYISNDLLFAAANSRTCADLLESSSMDRQFTANTNNSFFATLKRAFLGN